MNPVARNLFALVLVCSLGISALAPVAWAAAPPRGEIPADAVSITLHGRFSSPAGWGFGATNVTNPGPPLAVDLGDVITFTLFAADGIAHNLVIDLDSDNIQDAEEPESPDFTSASTPITWTETANTAGTFQYICGLHGGGTMRGTITVRGTTTPPAGDNTLLLVGGIAVVVVAVAAAAGIMMRRKKPKEPAQP